MIKLTKLFFAFSLLFALSSCGGDDDPVITTEDLVGTWKAASFSADVETTSTVSGTTTTVTSNSVGRNLDYEVTFDETSFMTNGSYDVVSEVSVNGTDIPTADQSVTDVTGSGTYTTDNNIITINGAFYELSVSGMDLDALSEEQTAEFEINSDGELIFTQDEEINTNQSGVSSTTKIVSRSTWVKQ